MTDWSLEEIKSLRTRFADLGCAQLFDAAPSLCFRLRLPLLNLTAPLKLAAPVIPVETHNDMLPGLQALDMAKPGYAVFIRNVGQESHALAGDIFTSAAAGQGVGGIVIDGAVRDVETIRPLGVPVFAREITFLPAKTAKAPAASVPAALTVPAIYLNDFGEALHFDAPLRYGDWIFGDEDGLLVASADKLRMIFNAASLLRDRESDLKLALRDGGRLGDLIGLCDFLADGRPLRFDV